MDAVVPGFCEAPGGAVEFGDEELGAAESEEAGGGIFVVADALPWVVGVTVGAAELG